MGSRLAALLRKPPRFPGDGGAAPAANGQSEILPPRSGCGIVG